MGKIEIIEIDIKWSYSQKHLWTFWGRAFWKVFQYLFYNNSVFIIELDN